MPKKIATSNPKLFIGMDIHKKSWKCHFASDITSGSTITMPPDADKLLDYIRNYYPEHGVTIAYETGCCGYEPARRFIDFGWDTYVVNPADIPRPSKQGAVKTDKIDARNIAMQLRAGNLCKLTIPSVERDCLRTLTRRRTQLVRRVRKIKLQIKSTLLYHGIAIPEKYDNPTWSKAFIRWLHDVEWYYSTIECSFVSMLEELSFMDKQLKDVSSSIRAYCRKHHKKDYNLLRSVPGIGPLSAAYMISEIGDIRRFSSVKCFASYVGMVPNVKSSGESTMAFGVTLRANRTIRTIVVEAAWVAIRHDPVLSEYFRKHAHHNAKAAIFKVARKLLSRIYAVVNTSIPYQIGLIA